MSKAKGKTRKSKRGKKNREKRRQEARQKRVQKVKRRHDEADRRRAKDRVRANTLVISVPKISAASDDTKIALPDTAASTSLEGQIGGTLANPAENAAEALPEPQKAPRTEKQIKAETAEILGPIVRVKKSASVGMSAPPLLPEEKAIDDDLDQNYILDTQISAAPPWQIVKSTGKSHLVDLHGGKTKWLAKRLIGTGKRYEYRAEK